MHAALKSAYQITQQRIISQPKDMMGILLLALRSPSFERMRMVAAAPHIPTAICSPILMSPRPRTSKHSERWWKKERTLTTSLCRPGRRFQCPIFSSPRTRSSLSNAPNFGSRRLFIITDNDDPHAGDKQAKSAAAVRAKDLYDLGVIIELFPIARADEKFDLAKFYDVSIPRELAESWDRHAKRHRTLSTVIRQRRQALRTRCKWPNPAMGCRCLNPWCQISTPSRHQSGHTSRNSRSRSRRVSPSPSMGTTSSRNSSQPAHAMCTLVEKKAAAGDRRDHQDDG